MPNSIINKVSSICDIPIEQVEELWKKAENIVINQYGKKNSKNYQLITSVFKHSVGKECNAKLNWKTNWGHKSVTEAVDNLIANVDPLYIPKPPNEVIKKQLVMFYNKQNGQLYEKPSSIPQPTGLFQDYIHPNQFD
jgi:hypothetical protein